MSFAIRNEKKKTETFVLHRTSDFFNFHRSFSLANWFNTNPCAAEWVLACVNCFRNRNNRTQDEKKKRTQKFPAFEFQSTFCKV